jgi:hypothetical protein
MENLKSPADHRMTTSAIKLWDLQSRPKWDIGGDTRPKGGRPNTGAEAR